MDINLSILKGRLTHDANENKGKDMSFFNFSMATNTGGSNDKGAFHRINYPCGSEKQAEFLTRHLVKGCSVYVEGEHRVFEKQDGTKMSFIRAANLQVLSFVEDTPTQAAHEPDPDEAALGFADPDPIPEPAPRVHQAPKARDMPAVAPRPRVQSTTMSSPQLVPASGGEVIF